MVIKNTACPEWSEFIQDLFEQASDPVQIVSAEGTVIYANSAWQKVLGHEWNESPLRFSDLLSAESQAVWQQAFQKSQAGGKPPSFQLLLKTQSGSLYPVEGTIHQKVCESSSPVFWSLWHGLKHPDTFFQQIVEHSPNPIFVVDRQGLIRFWSDACEQIFQYGQEICGRSFQPLLQSPQSLIQMQEMLEQVFAGQVLNDVEVLYCDRQGSDRPMRCRLYPLQDDRGQIEQCVVTNTDISDRQRVAAALSETEARYRAISERFNGILQSLDDVVWSSAVDGSCMFYVSPACQQMYGYSEAEFRDRPTLWQEIIHPDDSSRLESLFANLLTQGNFNAEYRILHKNGSIYWVYNRSWLVRDEQNVPIRIDGITSDVTERKQVEIALLKTLERERELNDLKSRFVSIVSHEFRTPLTTIQSSAELLEYYDWSEAERCERFQQIRSSVQHMTQLLEDVLLIGKVDAGKLQFNPQQLDLLQFCQQLVADFSLMFNNHRLQMEGVEQAQWACLDAKLLRQILSNLLSNAIKYSPQGGIIAFRLKHAPQQCIFQISDQGIGIPPADQSRLFEAFYRAANVDTIQGTGLGLAIVKKCVDLHQGQISVESEVGVGTTFTVTLPTEHSCGDTIYV